MCPGLGSPYEENGLMQKKQWKWLPTALLAVLLAACGKDEDTIKTCKGDKDCDKTEICHPHAGVCVQTCTSGDDCPQSAKTCDEIMAGEEQKICKCKTTELCNYGKKDSELVCNPIYEVCAPKDAKIGLEGPGEDIDEGCNPQNPQPDTCKYGLVCSDIDRQCDAAPTSLGCNDKFPKLGWNPSSPTGPIVYSVYSLGYGNRPSHCPSGYRNLQFKVEAYSVDEMLAPVDNVGFRLYRSPRDVESLVMGVSIYSNEWVKNGNNHATITINLCRPNSSSDNYVAGLAFDNGNTVCAIH